MRYSYIVWVATSIAVYGQSAFSQQPITLRGAIAMAQDRGLQAEAARATRDAARDRDAAFNARLFPQLFLTGNAANLQHALTPLTLPSGVTQFIGQAQNESNFAIGFSQKIPFTDGTVSISSAVSRIDQFGSSNARYYQTTPILLTLQQDLFKPRNIVWDRRIQSLSAAVADRGYTEAREDVAGATSDAFFDLYAQQMILANALENVGVNDTLYTLNKGRYAVGKIGENDLLKSELALLRARASEEDARLARDRAEAVMRRLIQYPENQPLSIVPPDSIPVVDADPDVAVTQALKHSSVIEQIALDTVVAKRGIVQARANNRFTASVTASVGFNQTAEVLGQSYQNPLGAQTLTVGLQFPLLQWGAGNAEVQGAEADAAGVQANNKIRKDALIEDARFSVLQLQQTQRNIVIAAKADTVAGKQFEVARNRYTVSKISNTDLYGAQSEKDAAVIAYVQALRAYWTAYYHLRRVTAYDFVMKQPLSTSR